jgi:hypothetical protein
MRAQHKQLAYMGNTTTVLRESNTLSIIKSWGVLVLALSRFAVKGAEETDVCQLILVYKHALANSKLSDVSYGFIDEENINTILPPIDFNGHFLHKKLFQKLKSIVAN